MIALVSIFLLLFGENYAKTPVVLVPGFGGTRMQGKLTEQPTFYRSFNSSLLCPSAHSSFSLWLNYELLTPLTLECWDNYVSMSFDKETGSTSNMPFIDIEVPEVGDSSSVECLDKFPFNICPPLLLGSRYFYWIGNMLTKKGYRRGHDLIGAPFDWRKAPAELSKFYDDLRMAIEIAYETNEKQRVLVVAHSMGNPIMYYFYRNMTQEWKDKYIDSHVALAAPWAGSAQLARLFASGYNLGLPNLILNPASIRRAERTFGSSFFLFPHPSAWDMSEVLVSTDKKSYSLSNVEEYFRDVGVENGFEQYKLFSGFGSKLVAPGVNLHCITGYGTPTGSTFIYPDGDFSKEPSHIITGDGDGTVNIKSAEMCNKWKNQDSAHKVKKTYLRKVDHMGILNDQRVLDIIDMYTD